MVLAGGLCVICISACTSSGNHQEKRFSLLRPEKTGITFSNKLTDTKDFNILSYLYYYNGGGVAVGDINNDQLPDIYFSANQLPNKLYLNKGNFTFEDITIAAGVDGNPGWTTGVNMADVNGDGWLDIYVCYLGNYLNVRGRNQLFINKKNNTFEDKAEEYGLDLVGFSTQSVFFDYDRDGDLDMYQLNHSVNPAGTVGDTSQRSFTDPFAGDKLMENKRGKFVDISQKAGVRGSKLGYGLGVIVNDINLDGWPDIYVCNDFHEDDYLYVNMGNGKFREQLRHRVGHTTKFSMGGDAADINRDGLVDFMTLDMKPEDPGILMTSEPPESYDLFQFKRSFGYYYQYPHNALQLNQGKGYFGEISQMAGIDATDWSWSVLFCDLDNDGWEDTYITNGIYRRPNDMDYLNFISDPVVVRKLNSAPSEEDLTFIEKMPQVNISNYAYRNVGNLTFRPVMDIWGLDQAAFSNGAAYADLDVDGDLDLIVNNINEPAFIYRNESREIDVVPDEQDDHELTKKRIDSTHYLAIKFKGAKANKFGIGASVWIYTDSTIQFRYHMPTRGFLSSMEPGLHVGLGTADRIDSLKVVWTDGTSQTLKEVASNQVITLNQIDALNSHQLESAQSSNFPDVFEELSSEWIPFIHKEDDFNDLNREPLLPHKLSTFGPCMDVADVNKDGLNDVYVGGAMGQAGKLYVQQPGRIFISHQEELWSQFIRREEVDCVFLDVDGDDDDDLYVVCGGNAYPKNHPEYQDVLFINDGKGNFSAASSLIPIFPSNGSCVAAGDFENDGDLDLFVGNRNIPGSYGLIPESYLLKNDGRGNFSLVYEDWSIGLRNIGMVTDALWNDYDADGEDDLIIVGEWMRIEIWKQFSGKLIKQTEVLGLSNSNGWWNNIIAGDWDRDGDTDFVVGNLGLNSALHSSLEEPCTLLVGDIDQNGSIESLLCHYIDGKQYPFAKKDQLQSQLTFIRKNFPTYESFAQKSVDAILKDHQDNIVQTLEAFTFEHQYIEQTTDGFRMIPLPKLSQAQPVYAMLSTDVDNDGWEDIVLGGNFYGVGPERGRYDAGKGLLLKGGTTTRWKAIPPSQSNLWLDGEVRAIELLDDPSALPWILVGKNNAPLQIIALNKEVSNDYLANKERGVSVHELLRQGSVTIEKYPSKEEFLMMIKEHPNLRFELTSEGSVSISSCISDESEKLASLIYAKMLMWASKEEKGKALDMSTKFIMPDGAVKSPYCAWLGRKNLNRNRSIQESFLSVVPDVVVEIRSEMDQFEHLHRKIEKDWMTQGVKLAWLIDPHEEMVSIYRKGKTVEIRKDFDKLVLDGEQVMPGMEISMKNFKLRK